MTNTQKVLLEHLASSLFGKPTKEEITKEVISEALDQAVATLLPIDNYAFYWGLVRSNVKVTVAHQRLHELMSRHGIPYVILKGLASASHYTDPDRRQMGDVDFIVKPEDFERTYNALTSEGFHGSEDKHEHHVRFETDFGVWELHWKAPGIPEGNAAEKYLEQIVDQAVAYDGCMIPSDFHHGLVILAHSAHHWINTGIGLRHLCDWAVFYARFSDDEFCSMFEKALKEAGLWKYARIITAACITYLGAPPRQWVGDVSADYVSQVMEDIHESGNFGCKDGERLNQAKLMTDGKDMTVNDTGMLKQIIKALAAKAQVQWPLFKKCPILLPFGVIGIAIRHVFKVLQNKRPQIHVKQMLTGAQERKAIYRDFSLFQPEK